MFEFIKSGDKIDEKYKNKALVNLWSSISDDTHDAFIDIADRYNCEDVVTFKEPDQPFKRDVYQAFSTGSVAKQQIRKTIENQLQNVAEVFTVTSPDGSGMMALHAAEPFQQIPLDTLTFLLVVSPEPLTYEKVCRAFNLAAIDPEKHNYVFISKHDHNEDETYPERMAKIIATMRWLDSTNIFHRVVAYRNMDPGPVNKRNISSAREEIKTTLLSLRSELGSWPQERLGFDPDHWLVDDEASKTNVWGEERYEAFVRIPKKYEGTNIADDLGSNDIDVNTDIVPVPRVQILLTREVSADFVKRVRTSHLRWLVRNAHEIDHWVKVVREQRGVDVDPLSAAEDFVTETLRVSDSDVLSVLEEEKEEVEPETEDKIGSRGEPADG